MRQKEYVYDITHTPDLGRLVVFGYLNNKLQPVIDSGGGLDLILQIAHPVPNQSGLGPL